MAGFKLRALFLLIFCVCLLFTILVITKPDVRYEAVLEQKVSDLYSRLQFAEDVNNRRETELRLIHGHLSKYLKLHSLNNSGVLVDGLSKARKSLPSFLVESILHNISHSMPESGFLRYLPHLSLHQDALIPDMAVTKNRHSVSVVIGVPTIKRQKELYLSETLHSLINSMDISDQEDSLIVVSIAEPYDRQYVLQVTKSIKEEFGQYIDSGLLDIIAPSSHFYPNLDGLQSTMGDTKDRVKWRTKQILDFTFLMIYARTRGLYYLQVEDDIICKPGYLSTIKSFARNRPGNWIFLTFSQLGFIGKLFRTVELYKFVDFLLMFYTDKPIDWLLDNYLYVKVCNLEKDMKHCRLEMNKVAIQFKPSLFQHIGVHSSLKGKVQKLKDKLFGKIPLYAGHSNPPADVSTTLKEYKQYKIQRAYVGETFFWALNPQSGDQVTFNFHPHINVESVFFKSGNPEHLGDIFFNTTVEIHPSQPVDIPGYKSLPDGYVIVGNFTGGSASVNLSHVQTTVMSLRLMCHSDSRNWVILSEIYVKARKPSR